MGCKANVVSRCEVFAVAGSQAKLCAIAQGAIVKLPEIATEVE